MTQQRTPTVRDLWSDRIARDALIGGFGALAMSALSSAFFPLLLPRWFGFALFALMGFALWTLAQRYQALTVTANTDDLDIAVTLTRAEPAPETETRPDAPPSLPDDDADAWWTR